MSALFEELDYRPTPMGAISLRRRRVLALDQDVYEVLLGDEHLMSSLFTVGETELAVRGLAATPGEGLRVVVGGLGLGHTARAALDDPRVAEVEVVEAMAAVIDWHRQGLVPLGAGLAADPRCRLVEDDFFARFARADAYAGGSLDAVLLDIDHSPRNLLSEAHAAFYEAEGLARLARFLKPGGVFALWSDEAPDAAFLDRLGAVFAAPEAQVVSFDNPLTGGASTCTVYVARRG